MDNRLLKNIISLLGVQGINYVIPLITLPYLVVTLGPESYGKLSFSLAFIQYFVLLVDYGFNLSATRQVSIDSECKHKISMIFWHVSICKIILFLVSVIVLIVFIKNNNYIAAHECILFSGLGLLLGNILFPVWLFQGLERMGLVSIINIMARLLSVPLVFGVIKTPADDWVVSLIYSFVAIFAGAISLFLLIRMKLIELVPISFKNIKFQFSNGWHLFISSASISLYTTSVTVILGFVAGSQAVGYFVSADKIRQALQGFIGPISQACFPRVNFVLSKNKEKGIYLIRNILKVQSIFTFAISILLLLFSEHIISLLYGNDYGQSALILKILSICPFLVGVSNVLGIQTMLSLGYNKEFSRILLFSGCFSLLIIYPLISTMGDIGAAISVFITEFIVVVMMMYFTCVKKKLLKVG